MVKSVYGDVRRGALRDGVRLMKVQILNAVSRPDPARGYAYRNTHPEVYLQYRIIKDRVTRDANPEFIPSQNRYFSSRYPDRSVVSSLTLFFLSEEETERAIGYSGRDSNVTRFRILG